MASASTGNWGAPIKVVSGNEHYFYYGELAVSSSKIGILIYPEYMDLPRVQLCSTLNFASMTVSHFPPIEDITFTTNSYMASITYDITGLPHIFMGNISGSNTFIDDLYKNESDVWKSNVVAQSFNNPNGPLCAALAPGDKIVLGITKVGN